MGHAVPGLEGLRRARSSSGVATSATATASKSDFQPQRVAQRARRILGCAIARQVGAVNQAAVAEMPYDAR